MDESLGVTKCFVTPEDQPNLRLLAADYNAAIKLARKLPPCYDGPLSITNKTGRVSRFLKEGARLDRLPSSP